MWEQFFFKNVYIHLKYLMQRNIIIIIIIKKILTLTKTQVTDKIFKLISIHTSVTYQPQ